MLVTVIFLWITCGTVQGSGVHPLAPAGVAPIVTAASSQYFERTFNRLVAPPLPQPAFQFAPAPVAPVIPITPSIAPTRPILSVLPLAPAPPVVVDASRGASVPANPENPPPSGHVDPNVAIAIATAYAAAPVATILLPPYPFGAPPTLGVLPQETKTSGAPNTKESTTQKTSTTVQAGTTQREEATTPVPSNIDNAFAQLPSNQNVNFRQYLTPQLPAPRPQQLPAPRPQQLPTARPQRFPIPNHGPQQIPQDLPLPDARPIKFKTNVEVVPVPLAYIAPPSPHQHHHNHQHHHHHHQSLKVVPHIHTFIPKTSKVIIRPVNAPLRIRTIRVPSGLAMYGPPKLVRRVALKYPQKIRSSSREPTTFRPINRPLTKPPRI